MALIAVFLAVFRDWRKYLSPGERAIVLLVAADREQAKILHRYCQGILRSVRTEVSLATHPVTILHFLEYVTPRSLVAASVRNVYGDPSKVTPALVDRYFDMTVRAGNRHALAQRFLQSDFGADVNMIAELKLPTLIVWGIVWGSRDRLIPLDYAERFHRDIAGSTMVVFPDLGHVPHEEDPVRTVAAVIDFLRSK
jgi:pimeloyl-ACP methyl ester carboxylesterase